MHLLSNIGRTEPTGKKGHVGWVLDGEQDREGPYLGGRDRAEDYGALPTPHLHDGRAGRRDIASPSAAAPPAQERADDAPLRPSLDFIQLPCREANGGAVVTGTTDSPDFRTSVRYLRGARREVHALRDDFGNTVV